MNILNVREYIETFLKIRTKDGTLMPLRLNQPQDRMYQAVKSQWDAGKPVRIIVLKARQMGFSTLTEAIIFAITATRFYTDCMIVAHKDEATANLFRMSLRYYENLPEPMKPMRKASNAHELVFDKPAHYKGRRPGLGSSIKCATAGGSAPPVPQAGAVPSWTGKGHCPRSHCRNSSRTGPRYECTGPLPPSAHGSCQLSCGCRASAAGTAGGCDRAGRTASNKDRLRACAFMEDSCLFSARCAPAMQALLAARPFLRHNQHEPGVSPPEGRDPVNLWRNNGELFRKRARLHR